MKSLAFLSAVTALGLSLSVYACSSNDSTLGVDMPESGGSGVGATSSTGNSTGNTNSTGIVGIGQGGGSGISTSGVIDPDAACGSSKQPAELTPIYILFVYDKSGSMGDDETNQVYNRASRWDPLKEGMLDFFANAGTSSGGIAPGVKASIKFFPAPGDKTQTCQANYKTTAASMVPLESPQTLIDTLNRTEPGGGTPTLPAVMGGLASAKKIMTDDVGSKAVVVLVTDGEPGIYNADTKTFEHDCAPKDADPTLLNDVEGIQSVVRAAYVGKPSVSTYVIGIGEATDAMGAIATAGGTEYLLLDSLSSPETTRAEFTKKLNEIRSQAIPCTMAIPDSSNFKKDLVNVNFEHSNGTLDQIGKSATCAAAGWYFDNEASPTKIQLCPEACANIQKDLEGSLQIILGCPTLIL